MNKTTINKLHAIAQFQKRLAWANYNAAKNSTMFKKELLECAKQAADNCRETRATIKRLIEQNDDNMINAQWANEGFPANFWD